MSSGCDGLSKSDAPRLPPEDKSSMDKTQVVAQDSPSSETNAEQISVMPVTNIDDIINELNSAENKEMDQNVLVLTDSDGNTGESSKVEEIKTSTAAPSHLNLLDITALDVENDTCNFPQGKTFLNSYSRNFSNMEDDIVPEGKEQREKPSMYSLLDDSDSESESATDSAVKAEKPQGHCEDPQDTDEEEVELCFSTVSQPAFSQSDGSSLPHGNSITDSQNIDQTLINTNIHNPPLLPTQDKDSQGNSLSITGDALLNGDTGHFPTQQEVMCVSPRTSASNADVKCETTSEPVKLCQTPKGVSCPVTQIDRHVTPRSQERTTKLHSPSTEKPSTVHVPLRSTVSEPKASNYTNGKSSGQVSTTQSAQDKEKEKVILDTKSSQSKSTTYNGRPLGTKSPNDNPVSPLLRNRLKLDDRKSNTSSKLKGLTIKSKCKEQEQSATRSTRTESLIHKKALSSPSQSPKLSTRKNIQIGSPKSSRSSEKIRVSCKTDQSQANMSNVLKANPIGNEKLKPDRLIADQKEQDSKPEVTVNTTQRTFIEVRLLSSSSSTPVLAHKEVHHASPATLIPVEREESNSEPSLGQHRVFLESTNTLNCPLPQNGTIKTSEAAEKVYCNGQDESPLRNSNNKDAVSSLKVSTSKLYLRGLERRSYSTDPGGGLDPNPFSVRQRIQSFENLASFDGSVVRCIDVPCYAINSKPPLNRRLSGYIVSSQSSDSRSLRRSLSSCVDSLSSAPSQLPQLQNSSSSSVITNPESTPSNGNTVTAEKEKARNSTSQNQSTVHMPPVLRSRNARAHGGLSRSRLREIRALSMPELDKLCTDDFSNDPGKVIFKTELEIHPRRPADAVLYNTQCTVVTRVSSVDAGAFGLDSNVEQNENQVTGLTCWSISLKDLESSPLDQNKVQDVLCSLTTKVDVTTLIQETNALSEVKEDIYFVILTKETGSGLGFSIAGGVDLEQKSITVHRVFTRGVAGVEGTINRGDRVLSINGTSMSGITHGEALSCLHQTRLPRQALVVIQKGKDTEPISSRPELPIRTQDHPSPGHRESFRGRKASVEVGPDGALSVELQKTAAGLGFSLDGGKASVHGDRPLYIKRLFRGGAAEQSRVVDVGDELLAINGRSLQGLMHYDAWNIIKMVSEGPVQLVIRKPRTSV